MKQYYSILACYSFDEKDKATWQLTGKKKYCIKWNQLFNDWRLSRYSFSWFLTEDEFLEKFSDVIDPEKYSLGLENKILEVKLVWTPEKVVEKIPERKSQN